jgi:hypothetical protein
LKIKIPRPILWVFKLLAWATILLGLALLIVQVLSASQGPNDLCQDYVSAGWLLQGKSLYEPLHCWTGHLYIPSPLELNPHPPFSILLVVPLALLSLTTAGIIWGLGSLAAYASAGLLLLKELRWLKLPGVTLFVLGTFLWFPVILAGNFLNIGQVMLLLLVIAWLLERRGHDQWAGAVLGLAGLLRLWPLVLLLHAVLQHKWRMLAAGAAVLLLGSALTLLVPGWGAYRSFLGPVQANEQHEIPARAGVSLVSAIVRLFTGYPEPHTSFPPLFHSLSLAQAILVAEGMSALLLLGGIVFLWWCQRRTRDEAAALLSQSILLCLVLLCFPVLWDWALMYLLLPGAMLTLALRRLPRPPGWWLIAMVYSLIPLLEPEWFLLTLPIQLLHQNSTLAQVATLVLTLPTCGLVLFAMLQCYLLWRLAKHRPADRIAVPEKPPEVALEASA